MFSLIGVWINDWVNNREAGDFRRYRGHYDASVMCMKHGLQWLISSLLWLAGKSMNRLKLPLQRILKQLQLTVGSLGRWKCLPCSKDHRQSIEQPCARRLSKRLLDWDMVVTLSSAKIQCLSTPFSQIRLASPDNVIRNDIAKIMQ